MTGRLLLAFALILVGGCTNSQSNQSDVHNVYLIPVQPDVHAVVLDDNHFEEPALSRLGEAVREAARSTNGRASFVLAREDSEAMHQRLRELWELQMPDEPPAFVVSDGTRAWELLTAV